MRSSKFTAVATPLKPAATVPVSSTKAGCTLFDQHKFVCPADSILNDLDIASCAFTPPIWLAKSEAIACLTDQAKQFANHPNDGHAYYGGYTFTHGGGDRVW